jgi:hypothetical protein
MTCACSPSQTCVECDALALEIPAQYAFVQRKGDVQLSGPRMMNHPLRIDRPFDIWQLGVLVYEIVQGQPYWKPGLSEAAVLHTLASKDMPLPHESSPLRLDNVQEMLCLLLARSPGDRPKHDGLKTVLEDHDKSGMMALQTAP